MIFPVSTATKVHNKRVASSLVENLTGYAPRSSRASFLELQGNSIQNEKRLEAFPRTGNMTDRASGVFYFLSYKTLSPT